MKKLYSVLGFLILALPCAYGQSYSSLALQNSPGSYARAIPYAQLTLCVSTDHAVPCTQKAAIFTDDSLTTQCTATNSSGTLTNAPISGANCNNPGISDGNGNFTIFALAGNYRLCTFGQTTLCQEITVGGGGTGNITCPGAMNGALAAWLNSTTVGCTNLAYTDFAGGLFSQFYQALGPVNGEVKLTTVGVVPTLALPAHTLSWVAPNIVPVPLRMNPPGVECLDGDVWQQLSHGLDPTSTENIYFNCLTPTFGSGSVTSFSAGNLSPLFTTSVATATTTPALTFALSNAAANTIFGNFTGSSGAPSYNAISDCGDSTHALNYTGGTGIGCQALSGGGGGASKIPFDSCNANQTINPGNAYWRTVTYAASAGVTSADIATWEYSVNTAGTVICKLEIPSNASGTIHVFLDLAANDSTAGHTAAFKVCYGFSSSQNINGVSYTCTATQNYTSTATAYANTRLDFTTAAGTIGEYLVANIVQSAGGTNTAPVRMVAKAKVF